MKKLVITGASGFLGYHLLKKAASLGYEVYGLYHSKHFSAPDVHSLFADITDYIALGNLLDDIEPDSVIHCAALAETNYCQNNTAHSYSVNVEATKNLAGICSDYNIPFVFTSTDLVFDGTKGLYTEKDERNPLMTYGEHKALAEDEVLRIYPPSLIVRLSLMFGDPQAGKGTYLQNLVNQLQHKQQPKLFHDEYRSVCSAADVAKGIFWLLGKSGVYHVAGKERLSRYEFGLLAAKALGYDEQAVLSCSQKDVVMAAPRPKDVSLNIEKALHEGYNPMPVAEELNRLAPLYQAGYSK